MREQYRERFAHVMVDEFQDTNRLQSSILELLSNDNLFTVGDANQSIYLFRNADVEVFREAQREAAAAGREARITHNFRSRRELLDVLNPAFEQALPAEDFEPLREGAEHGAAPVSPSVELLVVDRDGWGDAFPDGSEATPFGLPGQAPAWRMAEARLLAHRHRRARRAGRPVRARAGGGAAARQHRHVGLRARDRRARPSHLRRRRARLLEPAAGGRPARLPGGARQPARRAGALLAARLAARRGVPRRAGHDRAAREGRRRGTSGGRSRRESPRSCRRPTARACAPSSSASGPSARRAPRLSLESVIDRAVTGSGYDRRVLRMPGGERRMANVRKLMRLAREYEAEEGRELRGFIDFVAEQDLLRAREGEAPLETEGIDAVRLMTIHAAKGLEFPVVCVADLGRAGRDDKDALRITDDGRVGLSVASIGGGSTAGMALEEIKEEQARLADEEERRVFYVAMTRAREHLVLSGATQVAKWPEPRRLGPPIDWIWRAVAPDLRELEPSGESARGVRCVVCSPG